MTPIIIPRGLTFQSAIHTSVFNQGKDRRYCLERIWESNKKKAAAILMNPSAASELTGDETVDFLVNYVKQERLDYGRLTIVNTSPIVKGSKTRKADFIMDQVNTDIISEILETADLIILGWGKNGQNFGVPLMSATLRSLFLKNVQKLYVFGYGNKKDKIYPNHPHPQLKEDQFSLEHDLIPLSADHLKVLLDRKRFRK